MQFLSFFSIFCNGCSALSALHSVAMMESTLMEAVSFGTYIGRKRDQKLNCRWWLQLFSLGDSRDFHVQSFSEYLKLKQLYLCSYSSNLGALFFAWKLLSRGKFWATLELCRFNILEDIQKSVKAKMSKIKIEALRFKDLGIERFLSKKLDIR